jgi:peptidoglycan/LPS O-acetylase OafA/YrhL
MNQGHTTEIIRRRIRHWRTTLAGLACLLAPLAVAVWPQHADRIYAAAAALGGAGLIAAADAKKEKPPTP